MLEAQTAEMERRGKKNERHCCQMSNRWDLITNVQSDGEERANIYKIRCGTFPYNSPRKSVLL